MSDWGHANPLSGNIRHEISRGEERVEWTLALPPHTFPISVRGNENNQTTMRVDQEESCFVDLVHEGVSEGHEVIHAIAQATIDMSSSADLQNVWNIMGEDGDLFW